MTYAEYDDRKIVASIQFTTIAHGSFMFSFKTKPFYLEISNAEGISPRVPLFCSYHVLTSSVTYY